MIEERTELRKPEDKDHKGSTAIRVHYEPPLITTYSSEEILEQVGPAQACSPAPCGIF
jgi:hypothetical protein